MTTIISEKIETALHECEACASAADRCAYALLDSESAQASAACIRKCLDCATICRATATLLARGSGIATDLCRVCLESCLSCETECSSMDLEVARECSSACVRCEEALRGIA